MKQIVYNSQSRKKEEFVPLEVGRVKMYCCGPTVYGLLHVGNFRGAVFYNFVRNWFEHLGYKVTMVYNYTDVDDKIIKRAHEENVPAQEISERYIEEFKKDFSTLGLRPHDHNPKVSEYMKPIIEFVDCLLEKDKAYNAEGEILYSIKSFPEYGKLSGRHVDELMAGARVEVDQKKKDPMDFALWKPAKEGEPAWDSPWGKGRPGWHIECSAMARSLLGDQVDIHGGGTDLIFPHHENEIAQSEGCTGKQFVKYWIHNSMFNIGGQKMSKSLGNIWTAREFLTEYNAEIYKYMVMSVHYRTVSEFSDNTAQFAISALARVYSALAVAESVLQKWTEDHVEDLKYKDYLAEQWKKIEEAFCDDFSTPQAFATVFEVIRNFNAAVKRGMKPNTALAAKARQFTAFVRKFGGLMGLFQESPETFLLDLDNRLLLQMKLERQTVDGLVAARKLAREQKDFKKSDEIRDQLTKMGISVSDTPEGSYWEVAK